ncbi:MAG TPA: hydrogenase, partial [Candidatus Methylomirabilis sp.]|nr:hydrogenase [Candidatus Methylomirabilis sp.]
GLAVACFVKVNGAVFLGVPRTEEALGARDPGLLMRLPMGILAGACIFVGLAPAAVAPLLDAVAGSWFPAGPQAAPSFREMAPLGWLSAAGLALLAIALGAALLLRRASRGAARTVTWDCGYSRPAPSMQYTSSSFARTLVHLFGWALLPKTRAPRCEGALPAPAAFHSHVPDSILDRMVLPGFGALARVCSGFRLLQRGKINAYLLYIFIALLVLLLWK